MAPIFIIGSPRSGTSMLHWSPKEKVSRAEFFGFAGAGIDAMDRSRSESKRWLENIPRYVFLYDTLRLMSPSARFIHIVRDGRQVVDSMQRKFGWSFGYCLRAWSF